MAAYPRFPVVSDSGDAPDTRGHGRADADQARCADPAEKLASQSQ